jgi:hypothetical protein
MRASRYVFPLLLATSALVAIPTTIAFAQEDCNGAASITVAPPPLPEYAQPPIPGPGYIWTPGNWGYAAAGYYWVPGTWVQPPSVGLLWTPPYWGWNNGLYLFNAGYWGPTVGFYGGIHYGFGYNGFGYEGGRWDHDHFFYNRAVNNFGGVHIDNAYDSPVRNDFRMTRISYNGGADGVDARPTAEQAEFAGQHHMQPTHEQLAHFEAARSDRSLLASENHGRPPIAATERPGDFHGAAVAAREAGPANADRNLPELRAHGATGPAAAEARAGALPRPEDHAASGRTEPPRVEQAQDHRIEPRRAEPAQARRFEPQRVGQAQVHRFEPQQHVAVRQAAPHVMSRAPAARPEFRPQARAAARPEWRRPG